MAEGFFRTHVPQIARVLLGVIFTFSGTNYLFGFLHETYSPIGQGFVESLKASGFVWPMLKITELLCGLMLVFGYFGPLAIFILAPITLAIILFHTFLSPGQGAILGYVVFALELFLLFYFRKHFLHFFKDFNEDVEHTTPTQ